MASNVEETMTLFEWIKETQQHTQAIEYSVANQKYRIYQNTLESIEIGDLLPHCLAVKQKMHSATASQNHRDARYFNVMERTLGTAIKSVWDNLVTTNAYGANEAGIDQAIRDLVEVHATEEDRYELVQFLNNARKPRQMGVMAFYYRLIEINNYVPWLPGTENQLNANAIKASFFTAMPMKWRDRFDQAGNSRVTFTMAQVVRFFRKQESNANRKQFENELVQRRNKTRNGSTYRAKKDSTAKKEGDKTPYKKQVSFKKNTSKKYKRIEDDVSCPIHPDGGHTWGDCKSNAYSKKGKELRQAAYKKKQADVGSTRLYDTMSMHFYNPKMKTIAEGITSRCDTCQRYKQVGRGHGHVPAREAALLPWREVAVDLIGPWTLEIDGKKQQFHALTIIDMVTNLVEIKRLDNKTAAHVALQFENTWLARYPRPSKLIYDQGTEFTGYWFQRMLRKHNIAPHRITTKNPQANSVCERSHQSIGNSLRVLSVLEPPEGVDGVAHGDAKAKQMIDIAIANTIFAMRSTLNTSLGTTPGGLAFHRDMVLDLPIIADLQMIQQHRQQLIDQRLIRANRKRFSYDYAVNDEVLKLTYKPDKLEPRAIGPYHVIRVHSNGTLTIRINPHTVERINIRRVKPYRRSP